MAISRLLTKSQSESIHTGATAKSLRAIIYCAFKGKTYGELRLIVNCRDTMSWFLDWSLRRLQVAFSQGNARKPCPSSDPSDEA